MFTHSLQVVKKHIGFQHTPNVPMYKHIHLHTMCTWTCIHLDTQMQVNGNLIIDDICKSIET